MMHPAAASAFPTTIFVHVLRSISSNPLSETEIHEGILALKDCVPIALL